MLIEKIELSNVRIFEKYSCDFKPGINLIYGENGRGKTTILEAIHYLSLGKSFKPGLKKNTIRKGEKGFQIRGKIIDQYKKSKFIGVNISDDKQKVTVDNSSLNSIVELVGLLPVVIMSPEDVNILDGGGSIRRSFFDRIFSIVDRRYLLQLKEYKRILKQRRIVLLNNDSKSLNIWTEKLAESAISLWSKRAKYIQQYSDIFDTCWNSEFSELLSEMRYETKATETTEDFLKAVEGLQKQEMLRKSNLFGPHKDDFTFYYNGLPVKHFASQGEKKTVLTAIKHAESLFFQNYLKTSPLLLLDDLFAKLDNTRGLRTIKLLGSQFQTIITSTDQNVSELIDEHQDNIQKIHLN